MSFSDDFIWNQFISDGEKTGGAVRAFLRRTPLADGHCPSIGVSPLGQGEQGKPSESPCLADEELEHIALAGVF